MIIVHRESRCIRHRIGTSLITGAYFIYANEELSGYLKFNVK